MKTNGETDAPLGGGISTRHQVPEQVHQRHSQLLSKRGECRFCPKQLKRKKREKPIKISRKGSPSCALNNTNMCVRVPSWVVLPAGTSEVGVTYELKNAVFKTFVLWGSGRKGFFVAWVGFSLHGSRSWRELSVSFCKNEWSQSYRERNQHPRLPRKFVTHGPWTSAPCRV